MSTHVPDHKARLREALDILWNGNDYSRAAEFYTDDVVVYNMFDPVPRRGREALGELHRMLHVAFPDYNDTIDDLIQSGDEVAARWTVRGTHLGDYFGIPPTGRKVAHQEVVIFRFEGSLVKEMWLMPNIMGSMQQLGIPPGPAPAPVRALLGAAERLRKLFGGGAGP